MCIKSIIPDTVGLEARSQDHPRDRSPEKLHAARALRPQGHLGFCKGCGQVSPGLLSGGPSFVRLFKAPESLIEGDSGFEGARIAVPFVSARGGLWLELPGLFADHKDEDG